MANETFRTKGAIEPDSTFSSSSNSTFRWKGAVEPKQPPSVVVTDVNTTESWTDGDIALPITGTGFA